MKVTQVKKGDTVRRKAGGKAIVVNTDPYNVTLMFPGGKRLSPSDKRYTVTWAHLKEHYTL
jgi:hypothetical protein